MNEAGGGEPQNFEVVQPPKSPETAKGSVEQERPGQEAASGKQAMPSVIRQLPVIPDVPPPQVPAAAPTDDAAVSVKSPKTAVPPTDGTAISMSSPKTAKLPAADSDLIEKQWVDKAKEIVAETKSDPYKQKHEMSKAKADYVQKRFKKTLKTDDAVIA